MMERPNQINNFIHIQSLLHMHISQKHIINKSRLRGAWCLTQRSNFIARANTNTCAHANKRFLKCIRLLAYIKLICRYAGFSDHSSIIPSTRTLINNFVYCNLLCNKSILIGKDWWRRRQRWR